MYERPNSRLRRGLTVAAAIMTQLALAGAVQAVEQTRTLKQSFPVEGSQIVRLSNLIGKAHVMAGSGNAIEVTAVIRVDTADAAEGQAILDGMKWVHARDYKHRSEMALAYPIDQYRTFRRPDMMHWGQTNAHYMGRRVRIAGGRGLKLRADLEIRVPEGASLGLRNVVGKIDSDAVTANLDLDTASGDVDVVAVNGDLKVDTGSGDVSVGTVQGPVYVDTGSGDVVIDSVNGEKAFVDTGSGNVTIRQGRLAKVHVDTGSGDVELRDVDAEHVDVDTGSGDVVMSGPMERAREMLFDTGSGDVRIHGGANATFRLVADQGSGDLHSGYSDVRPITKGRYVIGYARGDEKTKISVDTGSGDCTIDPL